MDFISMSLPSKWRELIVKGEMSILPTKINFDKVPFTVYFIEEENQRTYIVGEFFCSKTTFWGYGNMDYPCPAYDGDTSMVEVGDGYYIMGGELDKTGLTYEELLSFGKDAEAVVDHYDNLYGWYISKFVFYEQKVISML